MDRLSVYTTNPRAHLDSGAPRELLVVVQVGRAGLAGQTRRSDLVANRNCLAFGYEHVSEMEEAREASIGVLDGDEVAGSVATEPGTGAARFGLDDNAVSDRTNWSSWHHAKVDRW